MVAIEFRSVFKHFYLQHQKTLKEFFQAFVVDKDKTIERVQALNDVSFKVEKGQSMGIIGKNGAGKSTLLKLIARVSTPTEGEVTVNGKVAPLLELGAGFHPELSGRENVFLNGVILGMTEQQVQDRFDDIVAFAELEQFIDMPVKHYSSGMYSRLAFSVAVSIDPDILLVDEVLSVGDLKFQKKCMSKMEEFKKKGVTIILVAHSMSTVSDFCDKALYLKEGKIAFDGSAHDTIDCYMKDIHLKVKNPEF